MPGAFSFKGREAGTVTDLIDLRYGSWSTRYGPRTPDHPGVLVDRGPEMCRSGRHVRTRENHPVGSDGFRRCRACEVERTGTPEKRQAIHEWQRDQQSRTLAGAVNKARRWAPSDDRALLRLRAAGITQPEIALALGRTYQSVRKRVGQLLAAGDRP